jgi:hypothetical protein
MFYPRRRSSLLRKGSPDAYDLLTSWATSFAAKKITSDLHNFLHVLGVKQLAGIFEGGLHVSLYQRQRFRRHVGWPLAKVRHADAYSISPRRRKGYT